MMAARLPPSSPAHPVNDTRKLIQKSGMKHPAGKETGPQGAMHGAKGTWVPLSWGAGRAWQALARPVQLVAAPACREGVGTRGQGLKQGLNPCHLMVPAPHHPTVPAPRGGD